MLISLVHYLERISSDTFDMGSRAHMVWDQSGTFGVGKLGTFGVGKSDTFGGDWHTFGTDQYNKIMPRCGSV